MVDNMRIGRFLTTWDSNRFVYLLKYIYPPCIDMLVVQLI